MDAAKNYDRYSDDPVLNKSGRPIVADMTCDKNPRIVRTIAEHNALSFDDLHAVIGGNRRCLYDNVRVLKARNNAYIRRIPEQTRTRNLREQMFLQLAPRGVEWLNAHGQRADQPRRVYNLGHTGLVSHIMASITAGAAQEKGARIVSWDEIQTHPKFPAETKTAKDNTAIPHANGHIRPDTHPFGIELPKDGKKAYRFVVVEADNGTETIYPTRPREYKGNSIYAKFEAYLQFIESKSFHTRYGLPNYYVLFVFTNRQRLANAMTLLGSMCHGSKFILFQETKQDAPPGYIFTSACERVGFDPLYLNHP